MMWKNEKVEDLIKKASELLEQKQYSSVISLIEENIKGNENNTELLLLLGTAYRKSLMFEDAINIFEKLLQIDPTHKKGLLGLADSWRGLKNWEKALSVWEMYLKIDPKDSLVITRMGDAYRKLKNYQKAEEYYLKAIELNNKNKFALMGIGDMFYKLEEFDKALTYWEKLVEIRPNTLNVLTMIGNIYRRKKIFSKAVGYYQRALGVDYENFYALYGIADSLRGMGQLKESLKYWIRLAEKYPDNPKILTRLGDTLLRINKENEAEVAFNKALETGYSKYALIGLVKIKAKRKEYQQAIEICNSLMKQHPDDIRIVTLLGDIYESMGLKKNAEALYKSALQRFKNNKELTSRLSKLSLKNFEDSIEKV
ncbi:MAG: tetratricopeptide repeat protein [Brevinematales bacterium]|nr:tetratricopeptide repeat protein [Brevinematales bacterium]